MLDPDISKLSLKEIHSTLATIDQVKMGKCGGRKFTLVTSDGKAHQFAMQDILKHIEKLAKNDLSTPDKKKVQELIDKLETLNKDYKVTVKKHGLIRFIFTKLRQLSNIGFSKTESFERLHDKSAYEEEQLTQDSEKKKTEPPEDTNKPKEIPKEKVEKEKQEKSSPLKENPLITTEVKKEGQPSPPPKENPPIIPEVKINTPPPVTAPPRLETVDDLLVSLKEKDYSAPEGENQGSQLIQKLLSDRSFNTHAEKIGVELAKLSEQKPSIAKIVLNFFNEIANDPPKGHYVQWRDKYNSFMTKFLGTDFSPNFNPLILNLFEINKTYYMPEDVLKNAYVHILKNNNEPDQLSFVFVANKSGGEIFLKCFTKPQIDLIATKLNQNEMLSTLAWYFDNTFALNDLSSKWNECSALLTKMVGLYPSLTALNMAKSHQFGIEANSPSLIALNIHEALNTLHSDLPNEEKKATIKQHFDSLCPNGGTEDHAFFGKFLAQKAPANLLGICIEAGDFYARFLTAFLIALLASNDKGRIQEGFKGYWGKMNPVSRKGSDQPFNQMLTHIDSKEKLTWVLETLRDNDQGKWDQLAWFLKRPLWDDNYRGDDLKITLSDEDIQACFDAIGKEVKKP